MKRCDGWPTLGCREQATERLHGYKLCDGCARKFNAPDPHEARTQRILAAHAPRLEIVNPTEPEQVADPRARPLPMNGSDYHHEGEC